MTTPTWQEAITPISADTYRDDFLAELEASGSKLNGWSDDSPQRPLVEGEARAMSAVSTNSSLLAKTASPVTVSEAGPSWVDVKMAWFNLPNGAGGFGRFQATHSVFQVELVIAASVSVLTIDSSNANSIQAQADDGTIFLCTQASPQTLNAGSSYHRSIQFTCRALGTVGNVTPGQITRLISGPAGLSVYAPSGSSQQQTTVARNQETDAAYITRGLGRWGTLGFSTTGGVAGWIRSAFDFLIPLYGSVPPTLNVTRWSVDDANPNGPGTVEVALANDAGPASDAEVAAVSGAVGGLLGLNGLAVKPVGSGALLVVPAVAHNVTLNITLLTDGSNTDVDAQATAALQALGALFPLGPSTLDPDLIIAIAMGGAIAAASIQTGATSQSVTLGLAGFPSVITITSNSVSSPVTLATGEVLVLSVNVTVTT